MEVYQWSTLVCSGENVREWKEQLARDSTWALVQSAVRVLIPPDGGEAEARGRPPTILNRYGVPYGLCYPGCLGFYQSRTGDSDGDMAIADEAELPALPRSQQWKQAADKLAFQDPAGGSRAEDGPSNRAPDLKFLFEYCTEVSSRSNIMP